MVVTQASLRFEDRGMGWAMLLGQLNRNLRLMAKVHMARGEDRQAAKLRVVDGNLELLRERLGPDTPKAQRGPEQRQAHGRERSVSERAVHASRRGLEGPHPNRGQ
jgi:hypothetical protein